MLTEIVSYINFGIILLGFFLFVSFLSSASQNRWLGFLNLAVSMHFLNILLLDLGMLQTQFGLAFGLAYGPLLFHFASAYTEGKSKYVGWNFLPFAFLILWILFSGIYVIQSHPLEVQLITVAVFIHFAIYLFRAYTKLKKFQSVAINVRSNLDTERITILRGSVLFIMIAYLLSLAEAYLPDASSGILSAGIIPTFILISQLILIFKGMRSSFVFASITEEEQAVVGDADQIKTNSLLSEEELQKHIATLERTMQEKKPFKKEALSLKDLSECTNIPIRDLSQVINGQFQKNYFEYVNGYRINEAMLLLASPDKRISEIMYDVGFTSRSSFNTFFKKQTGKTPSEYRENLV